MLDIASVQEQPTTVVKLSGSIDALTAEALVVALAVHIQAGRSQIVADFTEVSFTSSAGLRSLLISLKDARRNGGDLRLAAVQSSVQKVLTLSGFNSILKIFSSTQEAVESYTRAQP